MSQFYIFLHKLNIHLLKVGLSIKIAFHCLKTHFSGLERGS